MSFLLLLLASGFANSAIFGEDNRLPIQPGSSHSTLARSTALAVLRSNYSEVAPNFIKLELGKLSEFVCSDEKFASDPSMSYACTGFLVAPDLIATAGHCMVNTGESRDERGTYCEVYSWLFDFQEGVDFNRVSADNLYQCEKIIYAIKEEVAPYRDYALVKLNRPVEGRPPLKLTTQTLNTRESFSMIGYPFGTPAKLSWSAKLLLDNVERQSFLTNLDAFEGNSGSPVFNPAQEVVGILIGGTPSQSLVTDASKGCERYNVCDETGSQCNLNDKDTSLFPGFQQIGSEVQRIAPITELLNTLPQ